MSSINLRAMAFNFESAIKASTPTAAQGWQLTTLSSSTDEEKLELDKEIERLESVLSTEVGEWEVRLREVNGELSGKAQ